MSVSGSTSTNETTATSIGNEIVGDVAFDFGYLNVSTPTSLSISSTLSHLCSCSFCCTMLPRDNFLFNFVELPHPCKVARHMEQWPFIIATNDNNNNSLL
jgi:hypothetical protein